MKNGAELWADVCEKLQTKMARISYNTWIENALTPIAETDHVLLLKCISPVYRNAIYTSHHIETIQDCVDEMTDHAITVEVLCGDEADERARQLSSTDTKGSSTLNPKYTFDNFVVGNGNRFTQAVSLSVAESPAKDYNPLFIYGGVGLGKTHLMHAIGQYAQELYPDMTILYITSEDFTNQLIRALQTNQNEEFRNRFRNVDILLVDDIQFIAGKHSTEEEFFHTFNALISSKAQIVLTSDKPPKEIENLPERLCARFTGGIVTDIQRPDFETRMAILGKKTEYAKLKIGQDVLELIARNIESNVRELEGSLTRLLAYSNLTGRPIDMQLASEALHELFSHQAYRQVTADTILESVAGFYNISAEDIKGPSRVHEFMVPRQLAMYLCREMLGLSLSQIGKEFGGRHYSTVLSSINKVEDTMKHAPDVATLLDQIRSKIKGQ